MIIYHLGAIYHDLIQLVLIFENLNEILKYYVKKMFYFFFFISLVFFLMHLHAKRHPNISKNALSTNNAFLFYCYLSENTFPTEHSYYF